MYRNDRPLTCCNQNFDTPIRFGTPACQMNDDRQIAAESRQIVIFCSLKLWSYWTDLHQNFTLCTGISVVINPCIYKAMLQFVSKCHSRVKMVNFDVCKKVPDFIVYHWNVSSTTAKIISVLYSAYMSLPKMKSWWSSVQYLLRYLLWYVDFCRLVPKRTETPCEIFAVSGPIITKIATNVETIVPFIISEAELRYSNPLWSASMLNKGHFANFAQNRLPSQRP